MDKILPELIPSICYCLPNKDLLSMALSSRAVADSALDVLWRDITSFAPLICCLPADLLEIREERNIQVHYLRRAIRERDLERYLEIYAPRIRSVKSLNPTGSSRNPSLSVDVLQGLLIATDFNPGALSPNIANLEWAAPFYFRSTLGDQAGDMAVSYITLFTGRNLRSITITSPQHILSPLFKTSIFSAAGRAHGIRSLNLRILPPSLESFTDQLMLSYCWDSLESLAIPSISVHTVRVLGKLPRLLNLSLSDQETLPLLYTLTERPLLQEKAAFQSLRNLAITTHQHLSSAIAVMQHLPPANDLRTLRVRCFLDIPGNIRSLENINSLMNITLHAHCNPSQLKRLHLNVLGKTLREETQVDVDITNAIDLSSIYAFTELENIEIICPFHCPITPLQAMALGSTFSNLKWLVIAGPKRWHRPQPSISIEHILQLAHDLPGLLHLTVCFDATGARGDELVDGGPPSQLFSLDVDTSPILSPSRVLQCLLANFPKLHLLTHHFGGMGMGLSVEHDIHRQRWGVVTQGILDRQD